MARAVLPTAPGDRLSFRTMQVEHGVRFELSRVGAADEGATYRLLMATPEQAWHGEARIDGAQGEVSLSFDESPAPPAWCENIVRATLRGLFRERVAGKPFPARVTRWRPAPSEAKP